MEKGFGAWSDVYDHYWGDTDKSSSLENLGYDLGGLIPNLPAKMAFEACRY